jgi:predicted  nucleic acid-binding Zn-ribbon protein
MDDGENLASKLSVVLSELGDVMNARKEQIESLRDQITRIENENEDLEKSIRDLIDSF